MYDKTLKENSCSGNSTLLSGRRDIMSFDFVTINLKIKGNYYYPQTNTYTQLRHNKSTII